MTPSSPAEEVSEEEASEEEENENHVLVGKRLPVAAELLCPQHDTVSIARMTVTASYREPSSKVCHA